MYPMFYNTEQFAALRKVSVGHIQAACRNHVIHGERPPGEHSRLPEGWDAFKWGRVYIVHQTYARESVYQIFRVKNREGQPA